MTQTRTLPGSVSEATLYVAFELGKKEWKLAMTSGFGFEPWLRTVASGDLRAVERVLEAGRQRFGLPAPARVVSCYEAGRDGFLDSSGAGGPGRRESGGRFGEYRSESEGAAGEDGLARRAQAGAHAGAGVCRRASRVERGTGPDSGGRSGAPGESRTDGADAGSDAARQSDAGLARDLGRDAADVAELAVGGCVCAIGRARPCRRKCKRGWRAPRPASTASRRRSRTCTCSSTRR